MRYVIAILVTVIIAGAGILGHQIRNLTADLRSEKFAHLQTRQRLEQEQSRAEALADNARACLAREARAQADAAERSAILAIAAEKERTPEEKEKVADDETRAAVIERLNRGLW